MFGRICVCSIEWAESIVRIESSIEAILTTADSISARRWIISAKLIIANINEIIHTV